MGSQRILAYIFFILIAFVLPLLIIGAGILTLRAFTTVTPRLRRAGLLSGLGVLALILLDFLLLKALTWLGLSYGPISVPLLACASVRAALYIVWGNLVLRGGKDGIRPSAAAPLWAFNLVLTLVLVYSFYFEPFNLQVTHIQVPVMGAKISQPVRIVHLSDIHVERTSPRERKLVSVVQSQHPDLIVLTGDYLNLSFLDDPIALRDARDLIGQLHAPYGVYAVNGSVDNEKRMQDLFTGLDVTVLNDATTEVTTPGGAIHLTGVLNDKQWRDEQALSWLAMDLPQNTYHILLYHTPDLIEEAARDGIDLYLAGHTHGGQVRLPLYGAIITSSIFGKQYEMGQYQLGTTMLYVSRGIGMEGSLAPRARFLASPEVVVIDLIP